jgi:hypothetical protein
MLKFVSQNCLPFFVKLVPKEFQGRLHESREAVTDLVAVY